MAENNERIQIQAMLNALKPHPRNNEFFSDIEGEEYNQLKNSIADMGIITPILVSPDMTIISGHQRYRAAHELGLKNVPVIIDQSIESEGDKLSKLIASNFQRTTNDPIKKAKWIVEYEELRGVRQGSAYKKAEPNNSAQVTQKDIAAELGISADTLQNMKKLLRLIPQFQETISDGCITPTVGFKVLAQLSEDEQKQLYEHLPSNRKLSQKKIEYFIGEMRNNHVQVNSGSSIPETTQTEISFEQKKEYALSLCKRMSEACMLLSPIIEYFITSEDVTDSNVNEVDKIHDAIYQISNQTMEMSRLLNDRAVKILLKQMDKKLKE